MHRHATVLRIVVLALSASIASAATLTPGTTVNVTKRTGHQSEPAIAINPTNSLNLVLAANTSSAGIIKSYSTDGGATWNTSVIADGNDAFTAACCDPSMAFDSFGNCYFCYLDANAVTAVVLLSTNGGATFTQLATVGSGGVDQPTITTGPHQNGTDQAVWLTFFTDASGGGVAVSSATATALNAVGAFSAPVMISGMSNFSFGDISVGPAGQVIVGAQTNNGSSSPTDLATSRNATGVGGAFTTAAVVTSVNVAAFQSIPAQTSRTVDAEIGLAYDRSGGTFNGRLYLIYTDRTGASDTNIFLRTSTDNGVTWGSAVQVNDDTSGRSQFFPRIAVDQTTGVIGIIFYDCRNDAGINGQGSTNSAANDDVTLFAAFSNDGGATVSPNVQITSGISRIPSSVDPNQFADYIGLAFRNNVMAATWTDNSNSTGDSPDTGSPRTAEIYTVAVTYDPTNNPAPVLGTLTPASAIVGGAGFTLTLDGKLFLPTATVQWSGQSDLTPVSVQGTRIKVNVPASYIAATGTVSITVTNPGPGGGPSNSISFAINNPAPVLTGISPGTTEVGGPSFTLTLTGSAFLPNATVTWTGQANLTPATVSSTQITVNVPASYIATIGTASIAVSNPGPGGGASAAKAFDIKSPNSAPSITSGPTATPATAGVGQTVTFGLAATDADNDTLTYTWNIDGGVFTDAAPTHAFTTAGVYTVDVTVSDGSGGTATGSVTVTVNAPVVGTGNDSDGDGFSDDYEIAAGTSPSNAADSPTGGAAPQFAELTQSKLAIKLNFAKPASDSISFSGTLPIAAGFSSANKTATIDVGGVVKAVTLNPKGKSPRGNTSFNLAIKSKQGVIAAQTAKFSVKLSKGDFATALADEGLTNADATMVTTSVLVRLIFGGVIYQHTQDVIYSAKAEKTGAAKAPK